MSDEQKRALRSNSEATRRQAVLNVIGGCIFGALALVLKERTGHAQAKTDKKTAKYQDHPNNGQSCAKCKYFRPPQSCQLVEGNISPGGWCSLFTAKA
jgi:hypothetical protein